MQHDVGFLTRNDFDDLKAIWRMSFQDTDNFTQTFLDKMFVDGLAIASREEGIVVSCAFLIPCQLIINGRCYSSYFLYAAATHPSHRGKGHMSAIMKYAQMIAAQRAIDYLTLTPASDELFDFYGKHGYWVAFYKKVVRFTRAELEERAVEPDLTYAYSLDILNTRMDCLGFGDYINWDKETLDYGMLSHNMSAGSVAFTSDGYAMYNMGKDTVYVEELCTLSDPGELFTMLLMEDEAEKFTFNLPVNSNIHSADEHIERVGMALPLNDDATAALKTMRNAYCGQILM